jgi:nicotinamidase-related amidase
MMNTHGIALLVIDLQNAYFNNDALRQRQDVLLKNTNKLIAVARRHDMPVFNAITQHHKDIATWTLNMLDDRQGYLFASDNDSDNIPGLDIQDSIEIIKTRDSAFCYTTLAAMLKNYAVDTIILCGVSTHTCIFQTASDAYAANFRVIIARDATATHQPDHHENALSILETEYRQRTMNETELEKYIQDNSQKNA